MTRKNGARNRRKSERFESEATLGPDEIAAYFEGLARGLREGQIALGEQAARFEAAVSGDVELEVEAQHRKKKSRIELTLSFRSRKPGRADDEDEEDDDDDEDDENAEHVAVAATIPDEMSF